MAQSPDPARFAKDVLPLLVSRCATGGCHESASLGWKLVPPDPAAPLPDPIATPGDLPPPWDADYRQTTRWLSYGAPEKSELLLKASNRMHHSGGQKLDPGGADFQLVAAWIATAEAR